MTVSLAGSTVELNQEWEMQAEVARQELRQQV